MLQRDREADHISPYLPISPHISPQAVLQRDREARAAKLRAAGVSLPAAGQAPEPRGSKQRLLSSTRHWRRSVRRCMYTASPPHSRLPAVPHHAERISIAAVKGVNRAILDRRAKLASALSRRA